MADLVLADRDVWAGLADGVRLPGQGGDAWGLVAERPGATYTTPPLQADFPCTHVGVHWRTDGGAQRGLRVELRASRDGQTWMPWRQVRPEVHGPERTGHAATLPTERETFGALLGVRLGRWLQVRLTFDEAGPGQAAVRALTLTCLDSRRPRAPTSGPSVRGRGEAGRARRSGAASSAPTRDDPVGALLAAPAGGEVIHRAGLTSFLERVVSREAWGADESLRFKDGDEVWPTAFVTPSLLVVHHTATDGDIGDAEADVRSIYAYHTVTQGWGDIGYHLLIDSSGRVYEGRRGREPDAAGQREIVSENVVAGHAFDYNYGSVGIALLGNFQIREPGQPMLDALVEALAFMAHRYGIDPTAAIGYPRARGDGTAIWRDDLDAISGHRDCIPTECPGEHVYGLLPEIRRQVEERLGARGPTTSMTRLPAERSSWPGDLVYEWAGDPTTVETSVRFAGWRRIPGSDKIEPLSGYTDDERPIWGPWTRDRVWSVPLPPDARGIYTLFVRARDAAGREGRLSDRWTVVVDRHVVFDDEARTMTHQDGDWRLSRSILGYAGTSYMEAVPVTPPARFRWELRVPEDGTYRLQALWTEAPDRTTRAVYRLHQGGQLVGEATADQQSAGGRWVALMEAPLTADTPCLVELIGADDGVVVADAVRLVLLGPT